MPHSRTIRFIHSHCTIPKFASLNSLDETLSNNIVFATCFLILSFFLQVIAFAVSYTWAASQNVCNADCIISTPTVPICGSLNNQALVDTWRAAGKKVILSVGGVSFVSRIIYFVQFFKYVFMFNLILIHPFCFC